MDSAFQAVGSAFQAVGLAVGVFDRMVEKSARKQQYKYEQKMKELEMISNSNLRDQYIYEMLLDKFLAPIEEAQNKIQNTAKHAQYLGEVVSYYYRDHNLSQEEAKILCSELRSLAVKITNAEALHELKIIYEAITDFVTLTAQFQHQERKYSISRAIRKNILDPLNTCIAKHQNFQRRIECYNTLEIFGKPRLEGNSQTTK
ncbi:hypothetical protein PN499_03855 [Kamptonema animale CS-326]|jgi:hypothetical protein|uniref:hypothetical protein n=1 Tax=Kamptonema animale TaxID=92934 RepID=UPI00232B3BEB|nr:hypothetical protein [Kamptonema animale]MDB9510336.1 hypothetical protein [Kamptonema animale CS-326]